MKMQEVRDKIIELTPQYMHKSASLKKALEIYFGLIKTTKEKDLDKIAVNIVTLATALKQPDISEIDAEDLVRNEFLVDLISPIVKGVRKEIFNNDKPPFRSIAEAGEWLYKESAKPIPKAKRLEAKRYLGFSRSYKDASMRKEIWSGGTRVYFENLMITFPGIKEENSGWTESVPVGWSEKLLILHRGIHQVENAVNFPEFAITAHILTGATPILPRYSIETRGQSSMITKENWYTRNQVVISLNAVDLSFEDLKKIYKEYRRRLNYTGKKSIRKKQLQIYKMVKDAGGVPQKGKNKFWMRVYSQWNSTHPEEAYASWGGIRKAYYKIEEKIMLAADPKDLFR